MNTAAPTPDADDPAALGELLARANAPAFVFTAHGMTAEQRTEFIRAFFACLTGMAEQSIGYPACREVLAFVAELKPVAQPRPLQ